MILNYATRLYVPDLRVTMEHIKDGIREQARGQCSQLPKGYLWQNSRFLVKMGTSSMLKYEMNKQTNSVVTKKLSDNGWTGQLSVPTTYLKCSKQDCLCSEYFNIM